MPKTVYFNYNFTSPVEEATQGQNIRIYPVSNLNPSTRNNTLGTQIQLNNLMNTCSDKVMPTTIGRNVMYMPTPSQLDSKYPGFMGTGNFNPSVHVPQQTLTGKIITSLMKKTGAISSG